MADSLNNLVLGGMWSVIHNAAYQGTKEGIVGFDVEGAVIAQHDPIVAARGFPDLDSQRLDRLAGSS